MNQIPVTISKDGKTVYAAVYSVTFDDEGNPPVTSTTVMTFDTATGTARTPAVIEGVVVEIENDRDRLFVRTIAPAANGQPVTHLAVIDTATGGVLGTPVTLDGVAVQPNGTPAVIIRGDRAYLITRQPNSNITNLAVTDTRTGAVLTNKSLTGAGSPSSTQLDVKDGAAYLTVVTPDLDENNQPSGGSHTAFYAFDSSTGAALGSPVIVEGEAVPIYSEDGTAQFLASNTGSGVMFTPASGGPSTLTTPPFDYVPTADGTHAWFVIPGGPGGTVVALFDLGNSAFPEPIFLDGDPGYGQVVDDDGDLFVTTTLADGSTQITRVPGDAPSGMRMMTLGDDSATPPVNLNVIYPDVEETPPLIQEQFLSNGSGPTQYSANGGGVLLSV
jgi:hypothetical protein